MAIAARRSRKWSPTVAAVETLKSHAIRALQELAAPREEDRPGARCLGSRQRCEKPDNPDDSEEVEQRR